MTAVCVPERLVGHLLAGHPWLYAESIPAIQEAQTGDFVALLSPKRRLLGIGLFDARSAIALRVLSTRAEDRPGPDLWRRRVREALRCRREALDLERTDAYRLLNGEGDRLPGIVVDNYAGYLSLKLDTEAWLPHLDDLCGALVEVVDPRGIYLKGVAGSRRKGARDPGPLAKPRTLYGEAPPEPTPVLEHGMRLGVSLVHGQKTGFFLDQRENRALIRRYAEGRTVLNLFSYTGGFSIAAALGGATRVASVDTAAAAIAGARENFALNGIDPDEHEFAAEDAFAYLERCAEAKRTFDLVICDPPSFAPRKQAVTNAVRAYTRLHRQALRRVERGGLFAAASCSSHITMEMFLGTLREAAAKCRRPLRMIECRHQPADHPSYLHFPEGRYLKFALMTAD